MSFSTKASFSLALGVTATGVYAGNYRSSSPAPYTALVDYVFNTASPISPEDPTGPPVPDTTPPVVSGVSIAPTDSTAVVSWITNEAASSRVEFGPTSSLGSPAVSDSALVTDHSLNLSGLAPQSTYYYRVISTDASGNTTTTNQATFTTLPVQVGPAINLWYGNDLDVGGSVPVTQRFTDVQGNISDSSGIASVTARLNNGVPRAINLGADGRRLILPGDFVVDVYNAELNAGSNTLLIQALSNSGKTSSQTVTINYTPGTAPMVAQTIDWSNGPITSHASIIDGKWTKEAGGIRTVEAGYDRLVSVGDVAWTDYEVTVPITIHSYNDPTGPYSGYPAVGMLMRWNGHNNTIGAKQPLEGFSPDGVNPTPLGTYPVFRGNQLQIRNHYAVVAEKMYFPFSLGVTYMMKNRVETQPDGSTLYSLKAWEQGQPEPAYQLTYLAGTDDHQPASGSIVLLAHEADVTFGSVQISPVS